MTRLCALGLAVLLLAPVAVTGQDTPQAEAWRNFARSMEVGSELKVRLRNGQRFSAVLVQAGPDAMLLQPRTRIPVPVQPVPYDAVLALERRAAGGIGPGTAAAIGVGSGAAAFFAMLLILMAAVR